MALVFVEPRVASFTELHIFRCFARGDVRSIEQKTSFIFKAQSHTQGAKRGSW